MPLDQSIKTVLVIGSGPVVIGQAAEFDYAGSQACLSLREEGIRVVLLNSNPATIQTDHEIADRIYIEPILPETVERIVARENIDALLPTMGGQTALNLAVKLRKNGFFQRNKVRVIGTSVDSIETAEDRQAFHSLMLKIGEPVASSARLIRETFEKEIARLDIFPLIVRTSFSLGGSGGRILKTREELLNLSQEFFRIYPEESLEIEKSLEGLKEMEYEVIRDNAGNCITICNMENLDPMGVHTGESIVVTPSQTLSDMEYHMLRDSAIKVISALDIKGACNIQFALEPDSGVYYIVEVNPRTSRSSALASKASGYPIARTSSKIAAGYNLTEIKNPITGNTSAAYEPSLDYVTVKIPRWPFDKFEVDRKIGVQMKSIGEVMGIGRTFEEAFLKAIASLDTPESKKLRIKANDETLRELIRASSDLRIYAIIEALVRNWPPEEVARISGYAPYFVYKLKNIADLLAGLKAGTIPENLRELKVMGTPDSIISAFTGIPEREIVLHRLGLGIIPVYKAIDTCSGEFFAETQYMYSTYDRESEFPGKKTSKATVIIMGSGPNRISQGLEFDFGAVKTSLYLRRTGYRTVMVNSNPETVSTDFDVSDGLYFEPLTLEHISNIIKRESPCKIILQFSGQTGQNMAGDLQEIFGEDLFLGTSPASIDAIEDRKKFAETLRESGVKQPEFVTVSKLQEAIEAIERSNLPVIVRSSFIIGGRAMDIINDRDDLYNRVASLLEERPGYPVLLSRYVENAMEVDVDFISDGSDAVLCGVSVHIEEAGTHSGDATMIMGPDVPDEWLRQQIRNLVAMLTRKYSLKGFSNLQLAVKEKEIFVIELNSRASRSLPFVCKATGEDWIGAGISAMVNGHIQGGEVLPKNYFVKIPVFPFNRFIDLDVILGPEMKSTGEGMSAGKTIDEALIKALSMMNIKMVKSGTALISVSDQDKTGIIRICRFLQASGYKIVATPGTRRHLMENGIDADIIYKIEDMREPRIDWFIETAKLDLIINTPNTKSGALRDGHEIRRLAIRKNIPMITNMRLAEAMINSIKSEVNLDFLEIKEYW